MSEIRLRAEGAMKALDIVAPTLAELRAAIAAKDAEIDRLKAKLRGHAGVWWQDEMDDAKRRIAELEKALRKYMEDDWDCDCDICKLARAALEPK